jgi:membrane-bound lytic murein transglycosylase D
MKRFVFVGMVMLLMACSNFVHLREEASDHEPSRKPPEFPTEASLESGHGSTMASVEPAEPPYREVLAPSDKTSEGREGQVAEGNVGIPSPSLDAEAHAFSEPDLPPLGEGPYRGERGDQWSPGLPWGDEERSLGEAQVGFHDEPPPQEEEAPPEPEFDIPIVVNGKVEQWIQYYQTRGRKIFSQWLVRSGRYTPLMKELFRGKGLPEDLVYLALIESGCNPHAYSRRQAMGLWQFIYHTGKRYGLRVDWWIDERRDPVKSTVAAAQYLKDLYDQFECWYLAAAGYNAGEGKISRAIKRYKTEDFWELTKYPYLKRETKNFIPKMIAAAVIAKNPELYGFSDISYEEPIRFEMVKVPHATDLRVIAEASGSTYEELKRLNPELRRWCTPPDYPEYELKLPDGKKEIFLRNFSRIRPSERITYRRHVVRSGETLSHIARRYHIDIGAITRMNHIGNRHRIRAGESLIIPVRGSARFENADMAQRLNRERVPSDREGRGFIYTVREGDTLWDISRSAGIEMESLCRWNGIQNASMIHPGDTLRIPAGDRRVPSGTEGEVPPGTSPEG